MVSADLFFTYVLVILLLMIRKHNLKSGFTIMLVGHFGPGELFSKFCKHVAVIKGVRKTKVVFF